MERIKVRGKKIFVHPLLSKEEGAMS